MKFPSIKVHNPRHFIFGHVILFTLFLSLLPTDIFVGLERIFASFLVMLLLAYGITLNWNKSATIALIFVLIVGIIDEKGIYSDWKDIFKKKPKYSEFFDNDEEKVKKKNEDKLKSMVSEDITPAGDDPGELPPTNTTDKDDTGLMIEDLDTVLASDDSNENRGDMAQQKIFKEAGGGLEGLSKLLKDARDESVDGKEKSTDDHTPAEAQRKTHQMINTMKMLKETMSEMLPVMKQSTHVMDLYQKLGGKDMMKAFQ